MNDFVLEHYNYNLFGNRKGKLIDFMNSSVKLMAQDFALRSRLYKGTF